MKQVLMIMLVLLCTGVCITSARARDIEDFYMEMESSRTPEISRQYPDERMNVLIISASDEMIHLFISKGIESKYLSEDCSSIPDDVYLRMRSICADCKTEFCTALNNTVARLLDTHYDAIVVRIADVYWTVLT